eukprot:6385691-Pyramimonas_sp.AAC.1
MPGGERLELMVRASALGPSLAPSWGVLSASEFVMEPSWAVLGLAWGPLEPSWSLLGELVGTIAVILEHRKV